MNWPLTEVTVRMSVFSKKDPSNEVSFTNFFAEVRDFSSGADSKDA